MATIINPITTVLLNRAELDSGEFARFPFKYILETDGTIAYYSQLSAGRYLLSHEAKIPGLGSNKTVAAPISEIQPLAFGHKIPGDFFDQIKQFFLDVMGMGPSTYEAQTFIIWNTTSEEYRIVIPKQTVSAAAVRYDIGDVLADDDIIICDIHSHNDMAAFFSGTDDRDDKKNPWISGVFGKLSTKMENKFRFNDGCGRHFDMKAEEVFDFAEVPRFQTPKEWLSQVEITKYSPSKVNSVSSWGAAYNFADERDESPSAGWTSPARGSVDSSGFNWMDEFCNPEDDLYDSIVDSIADADNKECVTVLTAVQNHLLNPHGKDLTVLTDRESAMFVDITYQCTQAKNRDLTLRVISQLTEVY